MAPAVQSFRLALRPARLARRPVAPMLQRRHVSANEKPLPTKDTPGKGPNQEQLPHVSEEAAAIGKITGGGGPELEQGTPIQEVLQRDKESAKNAPEVLKEPESSPSSFAPKGTRSYSTSPARRRDLVIAAPAAVATTDRVKFGLPALPLPPHSNLHSRYPPLIERVTRLLMKDGKLARAQRHMARILNHLRTAPPPKLNPTRPLVPAAPPPQQLPLDPVEYLTAAIDSIAPLVRIKTMRGMAGGGQTLPIPVPLGLWQRRRRAVMWILEVCEKKRSRGAGHGLFASKVAEELIAIVEGRSGLWDRRTTLHKLGTSARANVPRYIARKK